MDIVLDSNIFRSDITLRSKEFDIILDYLEKTHSSIILPQIILDEIKGLFERLLKERSLELEKNINNINLLIINSEKHIQKKSFNIEDEIKIYEDFIKNKLRIRPINIIPYNNDFLPIISERAIKRIKPVGEKGQGFRDTIIWLTLKDYCLNCHEKQITFISSNSDDFASPDKENLHDSLKKECDELNIKINYFKSIKEFIENHSTKIEFINYNWISENIDYNYIKNKVVNYVNHIDQWLLKNRLQRVIGQKIESLRALSFDEQAFDDLSIYEMLDNKLIINFSLKGYLDLELNIYTNENWNKNQTYDINTINKKERVEVAVTITVISKEITETEVTGIYS